MWGMRGGILSRSFCYGPGARQKLRRSLAAEFKGRTFVMRLDGLLPSISGILQQTTYRPYCYWAECEERGRKSELTVMKFLEDWPE